MHMTFLYHWITRLFKRKRPSTPEEIARALPPEILAAVKQEAEYLKTHHQVDVKALSNGEKPSHPQAVDPLIEALFTEHRH